MIIRCFHIIILAFTLKSVEFSKQSLNKLSKYQPVKIEEKEDQQKQQKNFKNKVKIIQKMY